MSESSSGAVSTAERDGDDADLNIETIAVLGVAGELYGVTAEKVSEIVRLQQIIKVPNAPDLVEGVINLRGLILPIVDLRRHLALAVSDLISRSRIVIVEIEQAGLPVSIGLIVDSVEEVRTIDDSMVDNETPVVSAVGSEFLRGIVKLDDSLIILLDMDAIFEGTGAPR
jgi:purine-binding chemotaxis protein CheW